MNRRLVLASTLSLLIAGIPSAALRADEIKLKDGTKITGTIVGFEENSFKVKTSYGFAVVQKDQVVSIIVSDTSKKASAGSDHPVPESSTAPPAKPAKAEVAAVTPAPVVAAVKPASAPAPPPPAPPKPAAPEPMREQVGGNTYTNETYGFQMYKPPAWKVIEGARTLLPGSITAMGTDDQTTYLLIGQQNGAQSPAVNMDATERRLRDIMENFRPLDEKHITVSGIPAVERHFRGSIDQHDWSGVAVYITHDARLYTIFGMTVADTDLVQIQENVISRAI